MKRYKLAGAVALTISMLAPAYGQLVVPITSFENDRDGNDLVIGVPGYNSVFEVFFQDPAINETTTANILAKDAWEDIGCVVCPGSDCGSCGLPDNSLEESYVDDILGGSDGFQSSILFWFWSDPSDTDRWARVTTRNPPDFPAPAIHLAGKVRMQVRILPFGITGSNNLRLAFGLLVRETNTDVPLGFNGGNVGDLEFVGVSGLLNADSNSVIPQALPALTFDGNANPNFFTLEFDLATLPVAGWTAEGGDGTLDGTKGVLESLVVIPVLDSGSDVLLQIDEIVFEAPAGYNDPAIAPKIAVPVSGGANTVRVVDLITSASTVTVEVDRAYDGVTFVADDTFPEALGTVTFEDVTINPVLAIGDAVRASQTAPSGTSPFSDIVEITPPPPFTLSYSLDETGQGSVTLNFEWIGATNVVGAASPQGKSIFPDCGVWQQIEFWHDGTDPVLNFAGGNGVLDPSPFGVYSTDAFWFSIGGIQPDAGPYRTYLDQFYVIDENDQKIVLSDVEEFNPFPNRHFNPPDPASWSSVQTTDTSVDGQSSIQLDWEYPNTMPENSMAFYRLFPGLVYDDTVKRLGMYLLTEDCTTDGPPRPVMPEVIIGDSVINVSGLDPAVGIVQLYVNNVLTDSISTSGVTNVNIDPTVTLMVGDIITATQTISTEGPSNTSPKALPRGVIDTVPAPVIDPTVVAGDTVPVESVLTVPNATASLVTVYDGQTATVLGTAPGGTDTLDVPVSPDTVAGQVITATQTVNGIESPRSAERTVGAPPINTVKIYADDFDDLMAATRFSGVVYSTEVPAGPFDGVVDYALDYGSNGGLNLNLPPAPNSEGGTTIGLGIQVNNVNEPAVDEGESAGVSPLVANLPDDYIITADVYIDWEGGGGSSEHAFINVNSDLTSAPFRWVLGGPGVSYQVPRDIGSGSTTAIDDYYRIVDGVVAPLYGQEASVEDPSVLGIPFGGDPPPITPGYPDNRWFAMEVSVLGGIVTLKVEGVTIDVYDDSGRVTLGDILLGGSDYYNSANALNWIIFDNLNISTPSGADCPKPGSGGACPQCDLNESGLTEGLDISIITSSANFGLAADVAAEPCADVNGSGIVEGLDVAACTSSACFGL